MSDIDWRPSTGGEQLDGIDRIFRWKHTSISYSPTQPSGMRGYGKHPIHFLQHPADISSQAQCRASAIFHSFPPWATIDPSWLSNNYVT
jgi:hypothetical protein